MEFNKDLEFNLESLRTGYSRFFNMSDLEPLPVDEELSLNTLIPLKELRDNWYFIKLFGDKSYNYYYYKKIISLKEMLNELIGVEVSKYMCLPTVEYTIAEENGVISGLLSKNFNDPDKNYINSDSIRELNHYKRLRNLLLDSTPDFQNKGIKKLITTYFMNNFYLSLKDRTTNSKCYIDGMDVIIAPIFDYESAFLDPEMVNYIDPLFLHQISINKKVVNGIEKANNTFNEVVDKLNELNIKKIMDKVEDKNCIYIPDEIKGYYIDYDNKRREHMKTLGIKIK